MPSSNRVSITYGQLPQESILQSKFDEKVGEDGIFEIENCGETIDIDGDYTFSELHCLLKRLVRIHMNGRSEKQAKEAGDLASCILQSLDIEWV